MKETRNRRDTCYAMGYVLNAFPPLESFARANQKGKNNKKKRGKNKKNTEKSGERDRVGDRRKEREREAGI